MPSKSEALTRERERERDRESKNATKTGSVLIIALLVIGGIIGSSFVAYKIFRPPSPTTSLETEIQNTLTPTPSLENQLIQPDKKVKNDIEETPVPNEQTIKCLGADRKFFYTTQEACDAHTKYWTKLLGSFPTDPEEIIQCLGADGKYSTGPRKTCEDVNKFWAAHPPPGTSSSNSSSSTSSSSNSSSDTTAPLTTDNADSSWHTSNVTITLTCSDDSSGCDKTYYTTDSSTPTTLSTQGISILLTTSGTYTVKYFSVDKSGNQETVKTATNTVKVDKTAPIDPGTPTTTTPTNSTSQTWTWTAATDAVSGVANYAWRVATSLGAAVANGTTTLTTAATNLTQGVYDFFVKAIDNAGNQSGEVQGSATIDITAPVTSDNVDSSWHNTDVTITLSCNDTGGGSCATTYHTTNGTDPTTSSSTGTSFTLTSDGTYVIKYFSVDTVNNQESIKTAANQVKIDKTNPSGGSLTYTDGYYTTASVALTVSDGTDGGSGINTSSRTVQRKSATLSSGTCSSYDSFSTITPSGTYPNLIDSTVSTGNCYQYQYLISDSVGNQATYTTSNVAKVDTSSPSVPGTPSISTSNNATPTWTWTASTDSISGLANPTYTVEWSQDSNFGSGVTTTTINTNSFTHSSALANGTWYFRLKATDTAGNISSYSNNGFATVFPQNLLTNSGTEYEGFDTFAQWTQGSGTIANDATNFRTGTASLKFTTPSGSSATATKTINTTFGSAPRMRISFYLYDSYNELSNVQIRFSSVSTFAKVKYASPGRGTGFHSGWNTVDIYPGDWQDIGGEDWANAMIRLRLQIIPVAGKVANVSLDSLVRDVTGYPAIIISFDDGFSDAYSNAFSNMQSRNVKGNAYIITNNIGGGGNLTAVQLQEMFAAGWTIGNHTSDHTSLSGVAEATQETKIGDAKTALTNLGITTGDHLALPYGSWDENTLTACRNLGIKTSRTVQDAAYPLVNSDQMLLESSHVPTNVTTLAAVEAWVDEATTKSTPVWFQFHQIVDSPASTYQWSTSNFQSLLDYLLSHGVRTLTVDEFYKLNSGPVSVGHL